MIFQWIRFVICAVVMLAGLYLFAVAAVGTNSFGFVLNKMHAAGICDTLGSLLIIVSLVIATGFTALTLKLAIIVIFLWISSPVSTHLLAMIARHTESSLRENMKFEKEDKDGNL